MRRTSSLLFASLAVFSGACADKTGILVEVTSSDLSIPDDVDTLRFQAVSTGDHTVDQTFPLEGDWPHSLTFLPADDSDGAITVTITATHGGEFRVRRVVDVAFERGTTRRVVVTLSRDCLGRMCREGVDCVAGMCVDDVGTDGGVDGGGMDGGVDAGRFDAGPERDAGADGGVDAGRDAGMDAGPGELDAGRPDGGDPGMNVLIISEYVEGTSFNKYIEIFNPTGSPINLSGHGVRVYSNGSTSPSSTIGLNGTIESGGVFIIAHSSAALAGVTPNLSTGSLSFSGDDAVTLDGPSGRLDIVGVIGETSAPGGNRTFVRNAGVVRGRTTGGWVPSEWTELGTDEHELGSHNP